MPRTLDVTDAQRIDDAAEALFHQTFARRRTRIQFPFPLEWVMTDLRLREAWVEMRTILPTVESIAFLCVPYRRILIDESLHPLESPQLQSRLRFTLAHEIGHWLLHRNELDVAMGWACRDPTREVVREYEANRFAGALMIPGDSLREAWIEHFHRWSLRREDLLPNRHQLIREEIIRRQYCPEGDNATENLMFEGAVSSLAAQFGVSPQTMRIRAEELSLIVR